MHILVKLAAAMAVILAVRNGWQVDFTARSNNVGVSVETTCWKDDKLTFFALDYIHIEGETSSVPARRHNEVPRDSACTVRAFVFANDNKGDTFFVDPAGDYIIEGSEFVKQEGV